MPKTMNKADVLYRKDIASFDIAQISKISGKPLNNAVKSALEAAKKAVKSGEMKDGEGKIGLIEGHLFLRIKNGSKHEDDFLLVKNFTPPKDEDKPVRDPAYKKLVSDYIEARTTAYDQLVNGAKAIKAELAKLDEIKDRALDLLEEAKSGTFGYNDPGPRADELVKKAVLSTREIERLFKEEVHAPFDLHRNFASPKGVDNDDIAEYSRSFYLTKWRPVYGKAEENRRMAETTLGQIRDAAHSTRNFADVRSNKAENYTRLVESLATQAGEEVKAMTKVWGLQPIEDVTKGVNGDAKRIHDTRTDGQTPVNEREAVTARFLQTANERMVAMKTGYTRLQKHVEKMAEIANQLKGLPKEAASIAKVKEGVKTVAAAQKEMASYVKTVEGHMKDAAKAYANVKKEAATI